MTPICPHWFRDSLPEASFDLFGFAPTRWIRSETPRNRPTNQPTPPPSGRAENHKNGTSGLQPLGKGREESPSPAATGSSRYSPGVPLGLVEYRQLPATPHPTSCQDFGDIEGTFMHPGGDEEEKGLFEDGSQSTITVALPGSNKTSLPLSRPRLGGTAEEEAMPIITHMNLEYERMEQIMMLSMGYTPHLLSRDSIITTSLAGCLSTLSQ
ncbi:hypothetical protein PG997_004334 [Apiospora hydei]|uniref:Uncharacterized protein n=1 Tax=Apiospora hydei TaxID=1337664 RepID=A0ABR1X1U0_9PEZI